MKAVVTTIDGKEGFRTVNYDGRIYVIKPFKGKKGLKLAMQLTKYATGAFGGLLQGAVAEVQSGTDVEKLDAIGLMLSGVLQGAFTEMDDPKFLDFFFDLFSEVYIENNLINLDDEFALSYGRAFDLCRHIITYNFASVFTQLGIDTLLKRKATEV